MKNIHFYPRKFNFTCFVKRIAVFLENIFELALKKTAPFWHTSNVCYQRPFMIWSANSYVKVHQYKQIELLKTEPLGSFLMRFRRFWVQIFHPISYPFFATKLNFVANLLHFKKIRVIYATIFSKALLGAIK